MAYSDIQVIFELGHRASLKSKVSPDGFTHDWEVFVRGGDGADLSHFVEKVIFYLHETFPKPKRVSREHPYHVNESGYAGFTLTIDIYFDTKEEPKKFTCYYDLNLQNSGPPIYTFVKKKFIFPNPSAEFRKKLIKGGGVSIGDNGTTDKSNSDSLSKLSGVQNSKASSSVSGKSKPSSDIKKPKIKEPKIDDYRGNSTFAQLFGDPITTTKVSPDPKKQSASSSSVSKSVSNVKSSSKQSAEKISEKVDKTSSDVKSKHGSQKDSKKDKDSTSREDKKDKKDKGSDKKLLKNSSPKIIKDDSKRLLVDENNKDSIDPIKSERKKKDKKSKDERPKKDRHKDQAALKSIDKIQEKESKKSKLSPAAREPEKVKDKDKHRDGEKEKQKHKHKKKEKEKNKKSKEDGKERERSKRDKSEFKEKIKIFDDSKFKVPEPHSPSPPECSPPVKSAPEKAISPVTQKSTKNPLLRLFEECSDPVSSDSNMSSISADEDVVEFPPSKPSKKNERSKKVKKDSKERDLSVEKSSKSKNKDSDNDKRKGDEKTKEDKKRKRKSSRESEEMEPPPKVIKSEPTSIQPESEVVPDHPEISEQYKSELLELQKNIMSIDDDAELKRLVKVVMDTGQYEVTTDSVDFDLLSLDRTTVKRLQDFFRNL